MKNWRKQYVGCMDNKFGHCKGQFPRQTYNKTTVDPATGYLSLKKLEAWINTVTPLLCYIFQGNTDTTSLRSGTAIKGVLYYCTDYITKPGLKTHIIFDAIRCVLQLYLKAPWDGVIGLKFC